MFADPLCGRDYRCDTFGLGEEHLHKVWQAGQPWEDTANEPRKAQFKPHETGSGNVSTTWMWHDVQDSWSNL